MNQQIHIKTEKFLDRKTGKKKNIQTRKKTKEKYGWEKVKVGEEKE